MEDTEKYYRTILATDNNRFEGLLNVCGFKPVCVKCYYFNPRIYNPELAYRCYVLGSCPAISLSEELQNYLDRKYLESL